MLHQMFCANWLIRVDLVERCRCTGQLWIRMHHDLYVQQYNNSKTHKFHKCSRITDSTRYNETDAVALMWNNLYKQIRLVNIHRQKMPCNNQLRTIGMEIQSWCGAMWTCNILVHQFEPDNCWLLRMLRCRYDTMTQRGVISTYIHPPV